MWVIGSRRTVNASDARRAASSRARSASLGSRTKMGGCIPTRCYLGRLAQGLAWVCTSRRTGFPLLLPVAALLEPALALELLLLGRVGPQPQAGEARPTRLRRTE